MECISINEKKGKRAELLKKLNSTSSQQNRWTEFMSARSKLDAAIWEAEQVSCLATCRNLLRSMPVATGNHVDCGSGKHAISVGVIRGTAVFSQSDTVTNCFQEALVELTASSTSKRDRPLSVSISSSDSSSYKTTISAFIERLNESVNDLESDGKSERAAEDEQHVQLLQDARRRQCLAKLSEWLSRRAVQHGRNYSLFVILENADRFSAAALRELMRSLISFTDAVGECLRNSNQTFALSVALLLASPIVSPCSLLPSDVLPRLGCVVEVRAASLTSLVRACKQAGVAADREAQIASWSLGGFATRSHLATFQQVSETVSKEERIFHRFNMSRKRIASRLRFGVNVDVEDSAEGSNCFEISDLLGMLRRGCTPLLELITTVCAADLKRSGRRCHRDRTELCAALFRLAELEYVGAVKLRRAHWAAQVGPATIELLL